MNLNELISKYLDGELVEEEDNLLRSLLSEDDKAREQFDSAVTVHMACRDDAESIEPPKEFVRETEEKILMKILSEQPIVQDTVYHKARKSKAVAVFMMIFLIFGVATIHDLYIGAPGTNMQALVSDIEEGLDDGITYYEDKTIDDNAVIEETPDNNLLASNEDNSSNRTKIVKKNRQIDKVSSTSRPLADNSSDNTLLADNKSPDMNSLSNDGKAILSEPVAITTNNAYNALSNTTGAENNAALANGVQVIPELAKLPEYSSYGFGSSLLLGFNNIKQDVIINTFVGSEFSLEGVDATNKASFSQSIAYGINEKSRLGMEFGYSSYEYTKNFTVKTPFGDDDVLAGKIESVEVLTNNGNPKGIPMPMNINREVIWGAAFYERTLFESDAFKFDARLGLGATDEGMLGFARAYAKYEMFDIIALTIGADAKMFQYSFPSYNEMRTSWISSMTLVYGVQLKF